MLWCQNWRKHDGEAFPMLRVACSMRRWPVVCYWAQSGAGTVAVRVLCWGVFCFMIRRFVLCYGGLFYVRGPKLGQARWRNLFYVAGVLCYGNYPFLWFGRQHCKKQAGRGSISRLWISAISILTPTMSNFTAPCFEDQFLHDEAQHLICILRGELAKFNT